MKVLVEYGFYLNGRYLNKGDIVKVLPEDYKTYRTFLVVVPEKTNLTPLKVEKCL
ncbi:MAG: hypothetical protein ACTSWQ_00930 [Candidatus Thorarchaeota archaeon]